MSIYSVVGTERRFAFTRIAPQVYVVPNNQGTELWIISAHEENGSLTDAVTGKPTRGIFWRAARLALPKAEFFGLNFTSGERPAVNVDNSFDLDAIWNLVYDATDFEWNLIRTRHEALEIAARHVGELVKW